LGGPGSPVLAVTPTVLEAGVLRRSRMVINGVSFPWRLDDTSDCQGCYDLRTVLTHEFGHFIGYQHSACRRSIMYPEYNYGVGQHALDEADKEAFCGIDGRFPVTSYSPQDCPGYVPPQNSAGQPVGPAPGAPGQNRGGSCAADSECQVPYKCAAGSCDLSCTANPDCRQRAQWYGRDFVRLLRAVHRASRLQNRRVRAGVVGVALVLRILPDRRRLRADCHVHVSQHRRRRVYSQRSKLHSDGGCCARAAERSVLERQPLRRQPAVRAARQRAGVSRKMRHHA
jgi:Matrixin